MKMLNLILIYLSIFACLITAYYHRHHFPPRPASYRYRMSPPMYHLPPPPSYYYNNRMLPPNRSRFPPSAWSSPHRSNWMPSINRYYKRPPLPPTMPPYLSASENAYHNARGGKRGGGGEEERGDAERGGGGYSESYQSRAPKVSSSSSAYQRRNSPLPPSQEDKIPMYMASSSNDAPNSIRYIPVVKSVTHHHIHHVVAPKKQTKTLTQSAKTKAKSQKQYVVDPNIAQLSEILLKSLLVNGNNIKPQQQQLSHNQLRLLMSDDKIVRQGHLFSSSEDDEEPTNNSIEHDNGYNGNAFIQVPEYLPDDEDKSGRVRHELISQLIKLAQMSSKKKQKTKLDNFPTHYSSDTIAIQDGTEHENHYGTIENSNKIYNHATIKMMEHDEPSHAVESEESATQYQSESDSPYPIYLGNRNTENVIDEYQMERRSDEEETTAVIASTPQTTTTNANMTFTQHNV